MSGVAVGDAVYIHSGAYASYYGVVLQIAKRVLVQVSTQDPAGHTLVHSHWIARERLRVLSRSTVEIR